MHEAAGGRWLGIGVALCRQGSARSQSGSGPEYREENTIVAALAHARHKHGQRCGGGASARTTLFPRLHILSQGRTLTYFLAYWTGSPIGSVLLIDKRFYGRGEAATSRPPPHRLGSTPSKLKLFFALSWRPPPTSVVASSPGFDSQQTQ